MSYWVDIKGYKGVYQINKEGEVRSFAKKTIRFLTPHKHHTGYMVLSLRGKTRPQHRLLAETFIPNPEKKTQVNHINGVKHDNRLCNLEWVTPSENVIHAYAIGLKDLPLGSSNFNNKLKPNEVIEIRKMCATGKYTYREIGSKFNISLHNVKAINLGKTWKHLP